MRQLQRVAMLGCFSKNVAFVANVTVQRHHQLLANRIDGRIGNLCEQLLEVIEQWLRLVGKAGQRRIGTHGANGLFAFFAKRLQ